jgi:hypothetical protein
MSEEENVVGLFLGIVIGVFLGIGITVCCLEFTGSKSTVRDEAWIDEALGHAINNSRLKGVHWVSRDEW